MSEEVDSAEVNVGFAGDITNEDELLRLTQRVRVSALNDLMHVPKLGQDPKAVNSLAKLADGIDKQIQTGRRIKASEKANEVNGDLANTLNAWVTGKMGAKIQRHDAPPTDGGHRPIIPALPDVVHKEGELGPVGESIDVEGIMAIAFKSQRQREEEELDD